MPNWCCNRLVIKGDQEVVLALVVRVKEHTDALDFGKIIPMPAALRNTSSPNKQSQASALQKEFGHSDWYSWSVAFWGTTWNAGSSTVFTEMESGLQVLARADSNKGPQATATFDFATAWSPPKPVIVALSEMYPNLKITHSFIEEGMAFGGIDAYFGGDLIEEATNDDIYAISDWHEQFRQEEE